MTHEMKVLSAVLDKDLEGCWYIDLDCGHKIVDKTRKECKKYPHKKKFCGTCWSRETL